MIVCVHCDKTVIIINSLDLRRLITSLVSSTCFCDICTRNVFLPGYSSLNVMFHAKRSSRLYLGYHDVIVFDHVEKNVGGGYDGKSGKFTATIKGLYLFSTRVDTIQGKRIHIALVKNGKITNVVWSLHDTATITEPLILLPGDKVWVWHNRHSQEYVYRTNTIFGGTLIRRF